MADFFTRFSGLLDVGSAENVERALALYHDYAAELDRDDGIDIGFGAETFGNAVWIHDDGSGDVEHVIAFVTRCGPALGLTGRWGFQYANTCSRPRIEAFGGGAHVLDLATGAIVGWTDTDGWLAATLAGGAGG